jgi:hypothetical protein
MARVVWIISLIFALGTGVGPQGASGQDRTVSSDRSGRTVVNLFETLDPSSPIDGVRLDLPEGWTVQAAHLLRYGTTPVSVRHRDRRGTALLTAAAPLEAPHELVVQVQVEDRPGRYRWHLTPFTKTTAPERDSLQMRPTDRLTREIRVEPASPPNGSNQALDLTDASAPPELQVPPSHAPGQARSFTVEFWMQTTGLDQVVLSSWTGDEATPYALEFVTDQSGRLRYYTGRAGRHQALRSKKPVADGRWHHAAVIYDQAESRLHLMLDGTMADSAQVDALPRSSGPLPVALGGRPSPSTSPGASSDPSDASSAQRFAGRLDEIRIWPSARAASTIRRLRTRPFAGPSSPDANGPVRLSFDDASAPEELDWTEGARLVSTDLSFRPPLRRLRAQTDGQSVTLRWAAESVEAGEFVVERSPDGTAFTSIDRLSPTEAEALSDEQQEFVYTDEKVPGNVVFYRVRHVTPDSDTDRSTGTIKIGLGGEPAAQTTVELIRNFPNPFREATTIAYRVREAQPLTLTIWDLSGKRITTLTDGVQEPGYYEQTFTAGDLPSGTYFARLQTPQGIQSLRMVLLK